MNILAGAGLLLLAALILPNGVESIQWGMGIEQLKKQQIVHKASRGSEYSYADHAELDPDVYVGNTKDKRRIEYYFYKQKLYKVYIVYDRSVANKEYYAKLVDYNRRLYGKPIRVYEETVFGLKVNHSVWEDKNSILDIRYGAGYVYQVRTHKAAAEEKSRQHMRRKSV